MTAPSTMPPVFIVGCGRSGTTLLRAMLHQHPDLAIPLESLFIIDYLRAKDAPLERVRQRLVREYELGEWGMELTRGELLHELSGCDSVRAMIERLHELYARRLDATRWGQKTPRFVRHGDLLWQHWPGAPFVHVVRDPRAVVSSLIRSDVHRSNALYAARRWRKDVLAGRALAERRPEQVMEVHYEHLVREPADTLQRVCAFLDVSYDPRMLAYHQSTPGEYGQYYAMIHAALDRPPDPSRIDAWRESLTPRQLEMIESICGDLMPAYDYTPETTCQPQPLYALALRGQRFLGIARQIWHYTRTRRAYLRGYVGRKFALSLYRDLVRVND